MEKLKAILQYAITKKFKNNKHFALAKSIFFNNSVTVNKYSVC